MLVGCPPPRGAATGVRRAEYSNLVERLREGCQPAAPLGGSPLSSTKFSIPAAVLPEGPAGIIRRSGRRCLPRPCCRNPCPACASLRGRRVARRSSSPRARFQRLYRHRARGGEEAVLSDRLSLRELPRHIQLSLRSDGISRCVRKLIKRCVHGHRRFNRKAPPTIVAANDSSARLLAFDLKIRLKADHLCSANRATSAATAPFRAQNSLESSSKLYFISPARFALAVQQTVVGGQISRLDHSLTHRGSPRPVVARSVPSTVGVRFLEERARRIRLS